MAEELRGDLMAVVAMTFGPSAREIRWCPESLQELNLLEFGRKLLSLFSFGDSQGDGRSSAKPSVGQACRDH